MFPNTFHSDKWKTIFSNIPNSNDLKVLKYFNNYTRAITIPEYGIPSDYEIPQPPGFHILHTPMGGVNINKGLGDLTIEFAVSEDLMNYTLLWQLINEYRTGQLSNKQSNIYKDYNIKCFTILLLDNQHRDVLEMNFYEMFVQNITSLNLTQGSCTEVTFNATFKYNEIELKTIDPMVGGDVLITPDAENCGVSGVPINTNVTWQGN